MQAKWTEPEIQFIRDNRGTMSLNQIAKALGRTYQAACQQAKKRRIYSPVQIGRGNGLHPGVSYKKVLPQDQWHKAEVFLKMLYLAKEGGEANVDLKRLAGAFREFENKMASVRMGEYADC